MIKAKFRGEFSKVFMASTNQELFEFYQKAINNGDFWDYLSGYDYTVKELLEYDIIDIKIELKENFYFVIKASIKNQEAFDKYFEEELQLPKELFDNELRKELLEDQICFVSNALLLWEHYTFTKED